MLKLAKMEKIPQGAINSLQNRKKYDIIECERKRKRGEIVVSENLTPLAKQKTLKDSIEKISVKALSLGNVELSDKIGTIKGLYTAYELASAEVLLEKIAVLLAEIVEALLDEGTTPAAVAVSKEYIDIYERYKSFLIDFDRSFKTANIYVRALKRIIKNKDEDISKELFCKIEEVREIVESPSLDMKNKDTLISISEMLREIISIKDTDETEREKSKKDHGIGISALKQFLNFILLSYKQAMANENKS